MTPETFTALQEYLTQHADKFSLMMRGYNLLCRICQAVNPKYSKPPEYSVYEAFATCDIDCGRVKNIPMQLIANHTMFTNTASEYMVVDSLENLKAYMAKYCPDIFNKDDIKGCVDLQAAVARMYTMQDIPSVTPFEEYLMDNHIQYSYMAAALNLCHARSRIVDDDYGLALKLLLNTKDRKALLTTIFETRLTLAELELFIAGKPLAKKEAVANDEHMLLVSLHHVLDHMFNNPNGGSGTISSKKKGDKKYIITPEDVKLAKRLAKQIYNKRKNPTGDI